MGGGIFIDQGHPTIRGCIFTDNTADARGGGARCSSTSTAPEFRNCTFSDNNAGTGYGGGISGDYALLAINCTFTGNTAGRGGGVDSSYDAGGHAVSATLVNCQFIDNVASVFAGGGVYRFTSDATGSLTISNSLFNGNTTNNNGGGVHCTEGVLHITNCTVVHCSATGSGHIGGGVSNYVLSVGSTIANCIFYDNAGGGSPDVNDFSSNPAAVTYCASQQAISGDGNNQFTGSDSPDFVENSQTDPADNDYHLLCGSVCINAGDIGVPPADTNDIDEDGATSAERAPDLDLQDRIIGSAGGVTPATVDMGAYEKQFTAPCSNPPSGDCGPLPCTDGQVNINDLVLVILNWGACASYETFCPGDAVADSAHAVNIDDLVAVVTNWSASCVSESYDAGNLTSVEDCEDAADAYGDRYTEQWYNIFNKCVEGLCAEHIIDCD